MKVTVHMRLGLFVVAVFLVMLMICPAPASAAILSFSVTGQYLNMGMTPDTTVYNSTAANGINATVVSDGNWKITAYDGMPTNKAAGSAGHMAEAIGENFVSGGKYLVNPLQISGDSGSNYYDIPMAASPRQIASGGANSPGGTSVWPIFKQVVTKYEQGVSSTHTYRIVVTFEATNT